MKKMIPQKIKNAYHLLKAILANFYHGFPSRKIKIIGITGTNGKTTTVQMIAKILEEAGKKIAVASTINFKIADKEWVNETKFTTLSSFAVQKFISQAVEAGCEYMVLETSSHSLDQYRVWGVKYGTAIITNVTREHLDYHETMEKYREAKKILFEKVAKNRGTIIVNLDMEKPEEFLSFNAEKKYAYTICHSELDSAEFESRIKSGMTSGDIEIIKAEKIELDTQSSKYKIQNIEFSLHLPGEFNIENALAATCAGLSENIGLETIGKALEKIKNVPGRLEYIENDRNINIVIDYAVTPDSLEKLYALIKKTAGDGRKIISVFGSCGDRDKGKRPIMGEIVSQNADYLIVTNEDPYSEDPMKIIDEVASGIRGKIQDTNFWKILDRRDAIKKALTLATEGDYVIVTGKGAEEIMAVGDKRIPWNDKKVIEEELHKKS